MQNIFAFDTETDNLDPKFCSLLAVSFAFEDNSAFCVIIPQEENDKIDAFNDLRDVFENRKTIKVGHNLKYDITALRWNGIKVFGKCFDTFIAHSILEANMRHKLDAISRSLINYETIKFNDIFSESELKQKNKISAMVYPVIVMVIALGIVIFLLAYIVPKFEKIFTDMLGSADKLPWLTKVVVGASRWVSSNILIILSVIVVLFIGWVIFKSTKFGRRLIDTVKLKMPLFGSLQRKSAISRFSRTLGTLVTSGVPILQALNITKDTSGNVILEEAISKIHDSVKEGESIVTPMEASKVFPPMVVSMVDVGEETGQLPDMLMKVADVYDDEVDNAVAALTSILEPIMIVFLAIVVGIIVAALFLPLVKIIGDFGG